MFAGIALVAGLNGDGADGGSLTPSLSWLNPFGAGGAALTGGLLLGVFIYWGWESAVNLTEETAGRRVHPRQGSDRLHRGAAGDLPGRAPSRSSATSGPAFLADRSGDEETIFYTLATEVMGRWDWVLLLAVSTSAIASTQTTILPASRTGLSMARRHAMPGRLWPASTPGSGRPDVSTWTVAAIAIAWYLVVNLISENALFDSLTALSLLIAFYYSLTGIACAVFHRKQLTRSAKDFLLIGVGPVVGSALLIWLLVESIGDLADPANSYSGVVLVRGRPAAGDRHRHLRGRGRVHVRLAAPGRPLLGRADDDRRAAAGRHRGRPHGRRRRGPRPVNRPERGETNR